MRERLVRPRLGNARAHSSRYRVGSRVIKATTPRRGLSTHTASWQTIFASLCLWPNDHFAAADTARANALEECSVKEQERSTSSGPARLYADHHCRSSVVGDDGVVVVVLASGLEPIDSRLAMQQGDAAAIGRPPKRGTRSQEDADCYDRDTKQIRAIRRHCAGQRATGLSWWRTDGLASPRTYACASYATDSI